MDYIIIMYVRRQLQRGFCTKVLHYTYLEVTITFSLSSTKNVPNCLLPQANFAPTTPTITQLGQAPIPQEICGEL